MPSNFHNPQEPAYTCSCGPAFSSSSCPFFNRCLEPLAWSLTPSSITDQPNSPLYTTLPRELRDMIWAYALTDTTSYPVDCEPPQHEQERRSRHAASFSSGKLRTYPSDIAFALLRMCKAVYVETYALPLSLSPYVVPSLSNQIEHCKFLPWQLGLITGLDITLPQMAFEGGGFSIALKQWAPDLRHLGAYMVPHSWFNNNATGKITGCPVSFGNVFMREARTSNQPRSLAELLHRRPQPPNFPLTSTMRVAPSRPLTHLTIRLRATDWWTWGSAPFMLDPHHQLHLDPVIGDGRGVRGSSARMRELADERRAGRQPLPNTKETVYMDPDAKGWGAAISTLLPDLKTLELVLETFKVKEEQLDSVAECAKTWRFPIQGGQNVLVWDGKVETKKWQRGDGGLRLSRDAAWNVKCKDFEVRVVKFVRERVAQ